MYPDIQYSIGLECHALWPHDYPKGQLVEETQRHLTLALLDPPTYSAFHDRIPTFSEPPLHVGMVGYFDQCLFIPPDIPQKVAWKVHWHYPSENNFLKDLQNWLFPNEFVERPEDLSSVTLCYQPFDPVAWEENFVPLPFYLHAVHLYQSQDNRSYHSLWTQTFHAPFEEIEHTADIAFIVRGENLEQLYYNAFTALAFKGPELLQFFKIPHDLNTLDDLIIGLNENIAYTDSSIGCSMKAVSFHGKIEKMRTKHALLQWEMIVDV